jgi:hypothetical protein
MWHTQNRVTECNHKNVIRTEKPALLVPIFTNGFYFRSIAAGA